MKTKVTKAQQLRRPPFCRPEGDPPLHMVCISCQDKAETIIHISFECSVARLLWHLSPCPINISQTLFSSPVDWKCSIINADISSGILTASLLSFVLNVALVTDTLWFSQNKTVHEVIHVIVADMRDSLNNLYSDHLSAWVFQKTCFAAAWVPSEPSWMKINFDVPICQTGSSTAVFYRDSSSTLVRYTWSIFKLWTNLLVKL